MSYQNDGEKEKGSRTKHHTDLLSQWNW